jgi:hypothetical protein
MIFSLTLPDEAWSTLPLRALSCTYLVQLIRKCQKPINDNQWLGGLIMTSCFGLRYILVWAHSFIMFVQFSIHSDNNTWKRSIIRTPKVPPLQPIISFRKFTFFISMFNSELTYHTFWQIKKEISIMKIVRHPNIVRLNEVYWTSTFYCSCLLLVSKSITLHIVSFCVAV